MTALTARQKAVLDYMFEYTEDHGYPPTMREIGAHLGIRSTNGVNDHLKALERKGYIERDPLRSRGRWIRKTADPMPTRAELRVQLDLAAVKLAAAVRAIRYIAPRPWSIKMRGDVRLTECTAWTVMDANGFEVVDSENMPGMDLSKTIAWVTEINGLTRVEDQLAAMGPIVAATGPQGSADG